MTLPPEEPSASTLDVPDADVMNAVRRDRLRAELFDQQPKPRTIGRFVVRGMLGRGGMGSVLEAVDPTLDRPVALKLLHPRLAHDRERLLREARILAKVTHPQRGARVRGGRGGRAPVPRDGARGGGRRCRSGRHTGPAGASASMPTSRPGRGWPRRMRWV
jgi:hypothetical protein